MNKGILFLIFVLSLAGCAASPPVREPVAPLPPSAYQLPARTPLVGAALSPSEDSLYRSEAQEYHDAELEARMRDEMNAESDILFDEMMMRTVPRY